MIVLGIADNHDSGAALLIDGTLVAAINQERIDRKKNSGAFPWGAIDAVMDAGDVRPQNVDRIVIGTSFTPSSILRAFPTQHHTARGNGQFSSLLHAYILYQSALKKTGLHTLEVDASRAILQRRLRSRPFLNAELEMCDHHRAHAQGAYRTQERDHCLVLTLDAMGDGTTATASMGRNNQLDLLWRQSGTAAINTFYSRITQILGFTPNRHEGKITGLAAYVAPPKRLLDHCRKTIFFRNGRFSTMRRRKPGNPTDPFWNEFNNWSKEEVAAVAQKIIEECATAYVTFWVNKTGCPHVALAGGIFANVKLNQRICEVGPVETVWVMPHMGDGGLPVGAALGSMGIHPQRLASAYLGPLFTDKDARKALSLANLPRNQHEQNGGVVHTVAQRLAEGQVIARCGGRMEWGPRALGNRSILAMANDETINQTLNARLKRTEFMPFAPIVRAEDATRWFSGVARARDSARFMTVCFETTTEFQNKCPAAVHVDQTARPQLVSKDDNAEIHALLTKMDALTGVPVLINTSFNMHEEPIVCSAMDATRAWQQAELDGLWLGPYFVDGKP